MKIDIKNEGISPVFGDDEYYFKALRLITMPKAVYDL
jgi:hypothetical protein